MDIAGYKLTQKPIKISKSSCIYSALDGENEKSVLIKVFNKELSTNSDFRTHFRSTVRILRRQPLGNNARILDSKLLDNACILIMEYRDYASAKSKEEIGISTEETLEISRQLASSLSLLHKQKIVHGGVELSNISIEKNKEVVLGPVELQRTIPGGEPSKITVDKIEDIVYLAPEAKSGLTVATDFYALGVLMYELLVGKKPFDTKNIALLEKSKERGNYLPLEDKLRYLAPLFKKMLSPNPKMRVSNVYEFEFILSQCKELSARQNIGFDPEFGFIKGKTTTCQDSFTPKTNGVLRPMVIPMVIGFCMATALGILFNLFHFPSIFQKDNQTPEVTQSGERQNQAMTNHPTQSISSNKKYTEPDSLNTKMPTLTEEDKSGATLTEINNADTAGTNIDSTPKTNKKAEKEIEIRSLIAMAETQFNNNHLLSPPNDNAFETYQKIAALTPENDSRANEGLTKIADHFLDISKNYQDELKYKEAKEAIELGLKVKPEHKGLQALKKHLNDINLRDTPLAKAAPSPSIETNEKKQPRKAPVSDGKTGVSTTDNQQPPLPSHSNDSVAGAIQQPSGSNEPLKIDNNSNPNNTRTPPRSDNNPINSTLDTQTDPKNTWQNNIKEITKPANRQPQIIENRPIFSTPPVDTANDLTPTNKTAKIDEKIALVEKQLSPDTLSTSSLEIAASNYNSLKAGSHGDKRVSKLHEKILDSYLSLAKKKEKAHQLMDALNTADKGLALNSNHQGLLAIKNRIRKSLDRREKWEKVGPIIGTF